MPDTSWHAFCSRSVSGPVGFVALSTLTLTLTLSLTLTLDFMIAQL